MIMSAQTIKHRRSIQALVFTLRSTLIIGVCLRNAWANGGSYRLKCAAITSGGGQLTDPNTGADRGFAVVGQAVVGVMTGPNYVLEAGIVPCLFAGHGVYTLQLTIAHDYWGTVTVEPNLAKYGPNAIVTLTAVPIQGKSFSEWDIYDPNYPGNSYRMVIDANLTTRIVMNADRQVTAVFKCGSGMDEALPLLVVGLASLGLGARRLRRRR
jgi:hypothetical protein